MKATRARYTLEFKQEAVRLVEWGQSIAAASRTLGLVEQTLFNWVKAHREEARSRGRQATGQKGDRRARWEISRLQSTIWRVSRWSAIFLGKAMAYFAKRQEVKYALIRLCHCRVWPIRCYSAACSGVSVAGYHEHFVRRLHLARRRHLTAEALVVHIRAVFTANRGAYGWPRIWRELSAQGVRVGKRRVRRLMQQHGIRARGRRRFPRHYDRQSTQFADCAQPAESQLRRGCAQPGVDRRHHLHPNS